MATAQDTTVGPGIFITFEGGDGAGKTTHITFLAECLRKMGHEVLCLREPGGTAIGEALRSIVLIPKIQLCPIKPSCSSTKPLVLKS